MKWIKDFTTRLLESELVQSDDGNNSLPSAEYRWVNGSYRGVNGDRLHAFAEVGGFNGKVNAELKKLRAQGIKSDVLEVRLEVVPDGTGGGVNSGTMKWSVLIGPSSDGRSYLGITSCGSCCSGDAASRAAGQVDRMKTWNSRPERHVLVADIDNVSAGGGSKRCTDGKGFIKVPDGRTYKLRQLFYKYY